MSHRIKNTTCSKVCYGCVVSPHCEVLLSTREEVTANNDLFLQGDREGRVQTLRTIPDIESRRQPAGLQLFHGKNIHNGGRLHVSASKAELTTSGKTAPSTSNISSHSLTYLSSQLTLANPVRLSLDQQGWVSTAVSPLMKWFTLQYQDTHFFFPPLQ